MSREIKVSFNKSLKLTNVLIAELQLKENIQVVVEQMINFLKARGAILAGALVGAYFGAKVGALTGAIAGIAIGALVGYWGTNILDQWRAAYAQAASDARKLPWNGYVCIQTEIIGGALIVNFFRPPYVGV